MSAPLVATPRRWLEGDYLPQVPSPLFTGPWLVFAPHPDDETYGMGGAIAAARQHGIEVTVVVVTDGALGGSGGEALVALRESETAQAVSELGGATLYFLRYPDRGLVADASSVAALQQLLQCASPGTVFFPSPGEPHPDHRALAVMVWEAVRRDGLRWHAVSYDISVQGPCNALVDISAVMPCKRRAMAVYASQEAQRPYAEKIEALNRTRAWSLGEAVQFAEGFYRWPALDLPLAEVWLQALHAMAHEGLGGMSALTEAASGSQGAVIDPQQATAATAVDTRIAVLEAELNALRSSHSWRVTAPLRALSTLWARSRGRRLQGGRRRLMMVMTTDVVGGAEVLSLISVRGLVADYDISIVSHAPVLRLFEGLPVQCFDLADQDLSRPFDFRPANAWAYARAIAGYVAQTQADVVYGVMHGASTLVALARVARPTAFVGVRCVGSLHGSLATHYQHRGVPPNAVERWAVRLVPRLLHAIITPSHGVGRELVERFGVAEHKVFAIHNGFDFERIQALGREPVPLQKNSAWIVSCSRLSEQKDYDTLLRAIQRLLPRKVQLILVGEGELRAHIEQQIEALGLQQHVHLVGFDDNPYRWMRQADVFVLSSFFEGFGNVLVEAMLQDVPVVATDCPWGPAEIITHNENGLLTAVADVDGLAAALATLLDEPDVRDRLVSHARDSVQRFSQARMNAQYAAVFDGRPL